MSLFEVTTKWTGFPGAPGYTNFHVTNAGIYQSAVNAAVEAAHKFFTDVKDNFPAVVKFDVQQEVKELDVATGALIALASASTTPTQISGGSAYALGPGPSGGVVSWGTSGVHAGRRLRGRTFLVPLASNTYDDDGTLKTATITSLSTAAQNYRTSGAYESVIWGRPRAATLTKPAVVGEAFPIVSHRVPDIAAVLRSRRQ